MQDMMAAPGAGAALIGAPVPRIDGSDKVTGEADYTADHNPPGLLYAALVQSTIASGHVRWIDTDSVEVMPGVVAVMTSANVPRVRPAPTFPEGGAGQNLLPLHDERVRFNGQSVAVVLAQTPEVAAEAAGHVRVDYDISEAVTTMDDGARTVSPDEIGGENADATRGDPDDALAAAPVRIDETYTTPREYHCAMEPHATLALWRDDSLTVYEPTQWTEGARDAFASWFGLPREKIRIISPFVGGGFGAKGTVHPHAALAAMAARLVNRPVKLAMTRPQTFMTVGYRPATRQRVVLGADRDGRLRGAIHDCTNETSVYDAYVEAGADTSASLYDVPALRMTQRVVRVNAVTPTWMRAPGEAVGTYALESAMDELAAALNMDPVALRLRNHADRDPDSGKNWSSKALKACYAEGAKRFGWERRNPAPRSMRDGRTLIGWGMATSCFPAYVSPCEARVRVTADGRAVVESGGIDLGTGTYTILAQIAAETLGMSIERVKVRLGDTALPRATVAGGSRLASSLGPVVQNAAAAVRDELIAMVLADRASPLHGVRANDLRVADGRVVLARDPTRGDAFGDILRRAGRDSIDVQRDSFPPGTPEAEKAKAFASGAVTRGPASGSHAIRSFGAQFVEVRIDQDLGTVRIGRMVGSFDCGRVLNAATTRSQLMGGMIMGMGQALLEAGHVDRGTGRVVSANLAEYLMPLNADVPDIDVLLVGEPDPYSNALGTKPVGELGITGTAAAVANAVFHATGRRVRDLPITIESLL